jgi:hypothetical protein
VSNGATLRLTIVGEDKSASKALEGVGKKAEGVTDQLKGLAKAVAGLAVLNFAKTRSSRRRT